MIAEVIVLTALAIGILAYGLHAYWEWTDVLEEIRNEREGF